MSNNEERIELIEVQHLPQTPRKENKIDDLPNEILIYIFSFLQFSTEITKDLDQQEEFQQTRNVNSFNQMFQFLITKSPKELFNIFNNNDYNNGDNDTLQNKKFKHFISCMTFTKNNYLLLFRNAHAPIPTNKSILEEFKDKNNLNILFHLPHEPKKEENDLEIQNEENNICHLSFTEMMNKIEKEKDNIKFYEEIYNPDIINQQLEQQDEQINSDLLYNNNADNSDLKDKYSLFQLEQFCLYFLDFRSFYGQFIYQYIFYFPKMFTKLSLVSKKWFKIASHSYLWKESNTMFISYQLERNKIYYFLNNTIYPFTNNYSDKFYLTLTENMKITPKNDQFVPLEYNYDINVRFPNIPLKVNTFSEVIEIKNVNNTNKENNQREEEEEKASLLNLLKEQVTISDKKQLKFNRDAKWVKWNEILFFNPISARIILFLFILGIVISLYLMLNEFKEYFGKREVYLNNLNTTISMTTLQENIFDFTMILNNNNSTDNYQLNTLQSFNYHNFYLYELFIVFILFWYSFFYNIQTTRLYLPISHQDFSISVIPTVASHCYALFSNCFMFIYIIQYWINFIILLTINEKQSSPSQLICILIFSHSLWFILGFIYLYYGIHYIRMRQLKLYDFIIFLMEAYWSYLERIYRIYETNQIKAISDRCQIDDYDDFVIIERNTEYPYLSIPFQMLLFVTNLFLFISTLYLFITDSLQIYLFIVTIILFGITVLYQHFKLENYLMNVNFNILLKEYKEKLKTREENLYFNIYIKGNDEDIICELCDDN
ncbi:hypothetical protein ABK040_005172 [Willaertia magna]